LGRSILIDGRLVGYRRGGIATYARRLASLAPSQAPDLDIRVAVKNPTSDLLDRSTHVFTPPHHRLERYAFGAEVLARGVDLLHSVDYVQPIVPGVRTVVTVHDLAFLSRPELMTVDSFAYYRQIRCTVHQAERVIAVSEWTRGQLRDHLEIEASRISVVPNGVDHELFYPDASNDHVVLARLHPRFAGVIRDQRPVVLSVGTVEPRKRIDLLIHAFIHLDKVWPGGPGRRPILVVAGQAGWLADDVVRMLREQQRQDRVIWLRDVSDWELAALYRFSTLLAMPSLDEGFGLPVLEAMACGTSVLASANGALPELVGDAGYLEQSDDSEEWAHRIANTLSNEGDRQERANSGVARARSYSWSLTAKKTIDVYREVLEER
jgi:glycosyltransferase involved in cell wall biosynthesis